MEKKITIHLVGVDSRAKAGIQIALRNNVNGNIALEENGEIALIDGDSIDGVSYVEKELANFDIIMSNNSSQFEDHLYILQKPLKVGELVKLVDKIIKKRMEPPVSDEETEILTNDKTRIDDKIPTNDKIPAEDKIPANDKKIAFQRDNHAKVNGEVVNDYIANPFKKYQSKEFLDKFHHIHQFNALDENDSSEKNIHNEDGISGFSDSKPILNILDGEQDNPHDESTPTPALDQSSEPSDEIIFDKEIFDGIKLYEFENRRSSESKSICGQNHDVNLNDNPPQIYFDLDQYLCGKVLEARDRLNSKQWLILIRLGQDYILLDGRDNLVYTNLPETSLFAISLMPYRLEVSIEAIRDVNTIDRLIKRLPIAYYSSMSFFTSLLVLWSSRGRLPLGTKLDQTLILNGDGFDIFDKIRIPEVQKILSQWANQSISLFEIVKCLSLPQRYIFSFYCVACVLHLFDKDVYYSDNNANLGDGDVESLEYLLKELEGI